MPHRFNREQRQHYKAKKQRQRQARAGRLAAVSLDVEASRGEQAVLEGALPAQAVSVAAPLVDDLQFRSVYLCAAAKAGTTAGSMQLLVRYLINVGAVPEFTSEIESARADSSLLGPDFMFFYGSSAFLLLLNFSLVAAVDLSTRIERLALSEKFFTGNEWLADIADAIDSTMVVASSILSIIFAKNSSLYWNLTALPLLPFTCWSVLQHFIKLSNGDSLQWMPAQDIYANRSLVESNKKAAFLILMGLASNAILLFGLIGSIMELSYDVAEGYNPNLRFDTELPGELEKVQVGLQVSLQTLQLVFLLLCNRQQGRVHRAVMFDLVLYFYGALIAASFFLRVSGADGIGCSGVLTTLLTPFMLLAFVNKQEYNGIEERIEGFSSLSVSLLLSEAKAKAKAKSKFSRPYCPSRIEDFEGFGGSGDSNAGRDYVAMSETKEDGSTARRAASACWKSAVSGVTMFSQAASKSWGDCWGQRNGKRDFEMSNG